VFTIDTRTHEQRLLLHASEAIRDIAVNANGDIAIAAHDDLVYVGHKNGTAWERMTIAWRTLSLRARRIALALDGLLLAIDTGGSIWMYSVSQRTYEMVSAGISDLRVVTISHDGNGAAVLDTDGRIIHVDLEIARSQLNRNTNTKPEVQHNEEEVTQWLQKP
jgi:tricorn protease-like protein